MYSYKAIIVSFNKNNDIGMLQFSAPLQTGEFIELKEDKITIIYKIIAIVHPNEPTENIGDLYITRVNEKTHFVKRLLLQASS